MVGGEGIEPSHCCQYWILSPARLPIPPPARVDTLQLVTRTLAELLVNII